MTSPGIRDQNRDQGASVYFNPPGASRKDSARLLVFAAAGVLAVALVFRLLILASGAVTFHSDEAIVGLMARHINQGLPIPTFFYGQAYMGSLDPLLVAGVYRIVGEGVIGIRLVQAALFLGCVATAMLLTMRITMRGWPAIVAGLLLAIPPTMVTLYTTISLGGYGETLLLGNLILLICYEISNAQDRRLWRWAALGLLTGLGWWTNSLIVAYAIPAAVLILPRWRQIRWIDGLAVAVAFLIGSAPWWLYNLSHDWESVRFLLSGFQATGGGAKIGLADKGIGLLLLGFPALFGVRYSWTTGYWIGALALPVVILYAALLVGRNRAIRFLQAMIAGFAVIFVLSSFGVDATGRYLLPLIVPVAIVVAVQADRLRQRRSRVVRALAVLIPAALISVNLIGTVSAARTVPPGLTPQFDPATDFGNDSDQQVIDFLLANGGQYGYATYWAAYRLDFLSHEAVILTPALPYKATLVYTPTDRYPAYTVSVDRADHPVFVTANLPQLDRVIAKQLEAQGITYSQQSFGPYTVFYQLSQRVTPAELGLQQDLPVLPAGN